MGGNINDLDLEKVNGGYTVITTYKFDACDKFLDPDSGDYYYVKDALNTTDPMKWMTTIRVAPDGGCYWSSITVGTIVAHLKFFGNDKTGYAEAAKKAN